MKDNYTYIRIKDSKGGVKQVARFLESIPEQFNALLNLTDKATDLGLIVEKITANEFEEFNFLEDEKSISELTDLLNPKNKDNFETGGAVEKSSIADRLFKKHSDNSPLKNLTMETIIFESPVYKLVKIKPTALGDEFLLKFVKPLSTEDNRIISKNLFYIKAHYSPTYDAFVLKSALSKKEIEKMLEGSSLHNYSESNHEIMDVDYEDTPVERKDWFEISDNPEVNKYANIAIYDLVTKKGMNMEGAEAEIKKGVVDEEEHRETLQKVIDGKIGINEALVEIAYTHINKSKDGKFYVKSPTN
jgi:hypothetical protein